MLEIDDKVLKALVTRSFSSMKTWKWEPKEQNAISKALGRISQEECGVGSKVKSHDTVLGGCLEMLVEEVGRRNHDRYETLRQDRPQGKTTDLILVIDGVVNYVFVQTQRSTKNGDGNKAIKNKMRKESGSRGIVAIVTGYPERKLKGNILVLRGMELFRFLTSSDADMTDGDPELYGRIISTVQNLR